MLCTLCTEIKTLYLAIIIGLYVCFPMCFNSSHNNETQGDTKMCKCVFLSLNLVLHMTLLYCCLYYFLSPPLACNSSALLCADEVPPSSSLLSLVSLFPSLALPGSGATLD